MEATLEERVSHLELKVETLEHLLRSLQTGEKDWRASVGKLTDDEISREADRLGAEWRKAAK
jgi:chaperonin cofactor prefoldin